MSLLSMSPLDISVGRSAVGIGTSVPGTPLGFANVLSDQVYFWHSVAGDPVQYSRYGIAIQNSELWFFTSQTAVMTFGALAYADGTTFQEWMRIAPVGPGGD